MTDVMIVDPPGDPVARTGEPFFRMIVGVMDERGRFRASILLASPPIRP